MTRTTLPGPKAPADPPTHPHPTHRSAQPGTAAIALVLFLAACSGAPGVPADPLPGFAHPPGSAAAFEAHVSALAHDSMLGRAPGTPGGRMAERYIEQAFAQAGLDPSPGYDSYRQIVPLSGTRTDPASVRAALIRGEGTTTVTIDAAQIVASSSLDGDLIELEAPLVFVGHGVSMPWADHDDFVGLDLRGVIAVVLPGLPATVPDSARAEARFLGTREAKSIELSSRGATGLLQLSAPDGQSGFEGARDYAAGFGAVTPAWPERPPLDLQLTLSPSASASVLEQLGADWESASSVGPASVERGPTLRIAFAQSHEDRTAANILGVLPGRTDEFVVVSAHFDGYGTGPADSTGDSIYNAAHDNAAGTAGILELARVFAARSEPPERSLVFFATTAEERGRLGARYFLDHPVVPRGSMVANVNVDGLGFLAPSDGFAVFPTEGSDAIEWITPIGESMDLTYAPAPWHSGMHFAFDAGEFLSRGIPAFTVWQAGSVRAEFEGQRGTAGPTHSPRDEFNPDWIDAGIEQHLELYGRILGELANGGDPPRVDARGPFVVARRLLEASGSR